MFVVYTPILCWRPQYPIAMSLRVSYWLWEVWLSLTAFCTLKFAEKHSDSHFLEAQNYDTQHNCLADAPQGGRGLIKLAATDTQVKYIFCPYNDS
jgi:hypothetical protein